PEQARGEKKLDARVDVFALGCVLYRCLAGAPPFEADHVVAVLAKILLEDPPPLEGRCPEAPAALVELITRMLLKDPAARPRSAADVEAELARIDVRGTPAAKKQKAAKKEKRRSLGGSERRLQSVILAGHPKK